MSNIKYEPDPKTVLDIIHQDDTLKAYLKNDFRKYKTFLRKRNEIEC